MLNNFNKKCIHHFHIKPFSIAINRTGRQKDVPLTPIRRILFSEATPTPKHIETPKPTNNSLYVVTPNWRKNQTPKPIGMSAERIASPNLGRNSEYNVATNLLEQSLLDKTFTVMSILKEINMEKYATLFAREEIDLFVFLLLTPDDMIELGIDVADRIILLKAIRCYTEFFGNPEKLYY